MEYAIPRVKVGAYLDIAADIDKKFPDLSSSAKAREYAKAWDSIDNRFGQLVYDNLFWNKTVKDVAMMSTRSVGWNLGTIREIGGGITDVGTKTLRGKGVSDRTLYTIALPIYVGTLGAAYQYLHTGKGPKELKDYFYPSNGKFRVSIPSYMKDVYAYGTDPIKTVTNKASPLMSFTSNLAQNKNYYGDLIRNPDDPLGKQLQQLGTYTAQQVLPFSVTGFQQANKSGGTTEQKAEAFLGFNKAPSDIQKTAQEKKLSQLQRNKFGLSAPRTPEKAQQDQLIFDAKSQYKQGDKKAFEDLVRQGIITKKQKSSFLKSIKETTQQKIDYYKKHP